MGTHNWQPFNYSTNVQEKYAVLKQSTIVDHIPYSSVPAVLHLLKRSVNECTIEVTGAHVNYHVGYDMKMPCKYKLHGTKITQTGSRNL